MGGVCCVWEQCSCLAWAGHPVPQHPLATPRRHQPQPPLPTPAAFRYSRRHRHATLRPRRLRRQRPRSSPPGVASARFGCTRAPSRAPPPTWTRPGSSPGRSAAHVPLEPTPPTASSMFADSPRHCFDDLARSRVICQCWGPNRGTGRAARLGQPGLSFASEQSSVEADAAAAAYGARTPRDPGARLPAGVTLSLRAQSWWKNGGNPGPALPAGAASPGAHRQATGKGGDSNLACNRAGEAP